MRRSWLWYFRFAWRGVSAVWCFRAGKCGRCCVASVLCALRCSEFGSSCVCLCLFVCFCFCFSICFGTGGEVRRLYAKVVCAVLRCPLLTSRGGAETAEMAASAAAMERRSSRQGASRLVEAAEARRHEEDKGRRRCCRQGRGRGEVSSILLCCASLLLVVQCVALGFMTVCTGTTELADEGRRASGRLSSGPGTCSVALHVGP